MVTAIGVTAVESDASVTEIVTPLSHDGSCYWCDNSESDTSVTEIVTPLSH